MSEIDNWVIFLEKCMLLTCDDLEKINFYKKKSNFYKKHLLNFHKKLSIESMFCWKPPM